MSQEAGGKFRIGARDDVIFILYQRGDSPRTISERYGLSIEEVQAAIQRCLSGKKRPHSGAGG